MNKFKKVLLSMITCLVTIGVSTGCSKEEDDNLLRIVVLDAGYGSTWIKTLEKKFEASHPEIDVDVNAQYKAGDIIEKNLGSKKNKDDLYISVGTDWKSYAAQGKFLDLSDFLNEQVDGVSVKYKVANEYKESLYFTKSSGDKVCYRLPWTSGIGGIYYNKVLFEKYDWKVPTTFEELVTLCQTINDARKPAPDGENAIKPFSYTGANTDYFDYTVFDWWSQIVGVDAIKDFLKYESYENYDVTKNETYNGLKTATKYWEQLFVSNGGESNNVVSGSTSKLAADAQKEFANGYSAMMFNGDWLYNECLKYNISSETFQLGLMKTPVIKEAKDEYKDTSYVIGEDQYIAIPATSSKKELAKEFIKLIISDEGCLTFTKEANGFLAYNCDYTDSGITDEYINETIELRNSYTHKFTNFSSNRKFLCNYIDIWCTGGNRPFTNLLNGTKSVDSAFNEIASTAKAQWQDWTNKSK